MRRHRTGTTSKHYVSDLRGMRCKVAHGFADDEGHMETALEQVHTVLHLMGRPGDDPDAYVERTATVISAAIGAGCKRLVILSDLAAEQAPGQPLAEGTGRGGGHGS